MSSRPSISPISDTRKKVNVLDLISSLLTSLSPPREEGIEIEKCDLLMERGRLTTNRDIVVYINKEIVEEVSSQ